MKVPQLKKKLEIKSCHNIEWEDNYSWIHQKNILEVLKDKSKLDSEVKKYLEEENTYSQHHLKDTKEIQKKLFDEIKGRIKLDDESLPYKDHTYEYWTKTTAKGNYSIKLRKKIGSENIEEIWNGDKEKEKLKTEYFGVGDLEVSNNDKYLGYSLDLKGSEYYTIYLRDIKTNKIISKEITETSGGITFSLDDEYIFYSKLDENHRARKIYRHKIGDVDAKDELIFEEKSEAFTVSIGISSDEKYRIIRDQKIRERVEALGVKIQGDEDRETLLQKEKEYTLARQKIEFALESFYRSASSLVFQLNKRHITRHMSIFRCIDRRFETGEIFVKWDEASDDEWLLLIYIKNNSPDEGIVIEDKTNPEKNISHEFKNNEIFKASDTMVDALTQLIARKRAKNIN